MKAVAIVVLWLVVALGTVVTLHRAEASEPLVDLLRRSTAPVTVIGRDTNTCTAFSINEARRYWMTAYHCLAAADTRIDNQIAWAIYMNETHDIAILESPGVTAPSLKPAAEDPTEGQAIATFGFMYGFPAPQLRRGTVALARLAGENIDALADKDETHVVIFDTQWSGGISGSPVVNEAGEVVAIAQLEEGGRSGVGRPISLILEHTAQFWESR